MSITIPVRPEIGEYVRLVCADMGIPVINCWFGKTVGGIKYRDLFDYRMACDGVWYLKNKFWAVLLLASNLYANTEKEFSFKQWSAGLEIGRIQTKKKWYEEYLKYCDKYKYEHSSMTHFLICLRTTGFKLHGKKWEKN